MNGEYCLNCNYKKIDDVSTNHCDENITLFPIYLSAFLENIEKAWVDDNTKLHLCVNCKTTFFNFRAAQAKFLKLTNPTSKIAVVRRNRSNQDLQNADNKTVESVKTEFGYKHLKTEDCDSPCDQSQTETILPHTESNNLLHQSDRDGSSFTPSNSVNTIECEEKFLKLEIEKLSQTSIDDFLSKESQKNGSCDKNKQSHSCVICGRQLPEMQLLQNHCKSAHFNPTEFKYPCKFCSQKFSILWFFKKHLESRHHGIEILHSCEICRKNFHSQTDLKEHSLNVHDIREHPFKCVNCTDSFMKIKHLRAHLTENHKESKEAEIAESNIRFLAKSSLRKCSYCPEKFKKLTSLQHHIKSEHDKPGYECTICKLMFESQKKLSSHRNIHKSCDLCDKKYLSFFQLKKHIATVHERNKDRPYSCEICHQGHESYISLKAHYYWHKNIFGPRKHFCNICNKSYKLRGHLVQHIQLVHEQNQRKYKCDHCPEEFKEKHKLNFHLEKVHPTECLFPCKTCGKRFSTLKSVVGHSRVHTVATKFKKPNSEKISKFIYPNSEEIAEDIEVNSCFSQETFLFTCPFCSKSHESLSHFIRHLRLLHRVKGYTDRKIKVESNVKCSDCGKTFRRKDLMARHKREVHSENASELKAGKQATKYRQCPHCSKRIFKDIKAHTRRHEIFIVDVDKKTEKDLNEFYNEDSRSYNCFSCSETKFSGRKDFLKHLRTQKHINEVKVLFHDEKKKKSKFSFQCLSCPKSYESEAQLRQHTAIHERRGNGETKCNVCHLILATPWGLNRHTKRHHSKISNKKKNV